MVALSKDRRKAIRWAIAGLLVLDLALVMVNWRLGQGGQPGNGELQLLRRQRDLLAADVERGRRIREELPAVEQQGDAFFNEQLRPLATAYSGVLDNLGAIARGAGLAADNISFRQNAPDPRGVVEVEIAATVNGDYPSVVRFIHGIERADSFYVLDSLSLAPGTAGELRLNLRLRTYFRTS